MPPKKQAKKTQRVSFEAEATVEESIHELFEEQYGRPAKVSANTYLVKILYEKA